MPLMADARMTTGLFALGMASSAYHHSLRYARSRIQGRPFQSAADVHASRVPIIEHLDVQRMLLEMKTKVEGCRGLLGKMSLQLSRQLALKAQPAPDERALDRTQRLMLFYVPIVKAYVSDQAWRICELAIQVHGGVGYTKDTPVEQYARDVKVLSIWEGTNYIQSQDLLREKLSFGRDSRTIRYLREDVEAFLDGVTDPELAPECACVRNALADCIAALDVLAGIVQSGHMASVSQFSTRLLEMLAETCVAWVLLESAVAARRALARGNPGATKADFYRGKVDAARFFIHNILPAVHGRLQVIRNHDKSLVALASERFGYLAPSRIPRSSPRLPCPPCPRKKRRSPRRSEMVTLFDSLQATAAVRASHTALVHQDESLSYAQLLAQARAAAGAMRALGVRAGDRVAIHSDKRFEFVVALLGASAAGAVFVPINPQLKAHQVLHILRDAEAKLLVTTRARHDALREVDEDLPPTLLFTDPDAASRSIAADQQWDRQLGAAVPVAEAARVVDSDLAAILYTSGSTGMPKGVMVTHRNLGSGAASVNQYLGNRADEVILSLLPLEFRCPRPEPAHHGDRRRRHAGAAEFPDRRRGRARLPPARRDRDDGSAAAVAPAGRGALARGSRRPSALFRQYRGPHARHPAGARCARCSPMRGPS